MTHNVSLNDTFESGMDSFVCDDFKKSVKDFTKVIEIGPDNSKPYHLRELAQVEAEAHKEALEHFESAIDLDPDYGSAYTAGQFFKSSLAEKIWPQRIYRWSMS